MYIYIQVFWLEHFSQAKLINMSLASIFLVGNFNSEVKLIAVRLKDTVKVQLKDGSDLAVRCNLKVDKFRS